MLQIESGVAVCKAYLLRYLSGHSQVDFPNQKQCLAGEGGIRLRSWCHCQLFVSVLEQWGSGEFPQERPVLTPQASGRGGKAELGLWVVEGREAECSATGSGSRALVLRESPALLQMSKPNATLLGAGASARMWVSAWYEWDRDCESECRGESGWDQCEHG